MSGSSEWQPIETAPKDGTPIWGFEDDHVAHGCMAMMAWAEEIRREDQSVYKPARWELVTLVWGDESSEAYPTHWMPLPEPPKTV